MYFKVLAFPAVLKIVSGRDQPVCAPDVRWSRTGGVDVTGSFFLYKSLFKLFILFKRIIRRKSKFQTLKHQFDLLVEHFFLACFLHFTY